MLCLYIKTGALAVPFLRPCIGLAMSIKKYKYTIELPSGYDPSWSMSVIVAFGINIRTTRPVILF